MGDRENLSRKVKNINATVEPKTKDVSSNQICDLLQQINAKMDKNHSDLTTQLQSESTSIRSDFHNHFSVFDDKIASVRFDLQMQSDRVDIVESIIESNNRTKRFNDVILRGIPVNEKDLTGVFDAISKFIKFIHFNFTCVNNIFRVAIKNGNAPIIVQFTSILFKRQFMTNFIKSGRVKLSDVGMESSAYIYVADNLTKINGEIHHKALQLLRDKKLSKVQIRSGFVYVQMPDATESIKITNLDDLNDDIETTDVDQTIIEQQK